MSEWGNLTGVVGNIRRWSGPYSGCGSQHCLDHRQPFIEATLAQLHKRKDPVWWISRRTSLLYSPTLWKKTRKEEKHADRCLICNFRIDLLVWDQSGGKVIPWQNHSTMPSIFQHLYTTIVLVIVAAVIVLRKNATVKVLDIVVPIMAVIYFELRFL